METIHGMVGAPLMRVGGSENRRALGRIDDVTDSGCLAPGKLDPSLPRSPRKSTTPTEGTRRIEREKVFLAGQGDVLRAQRCVSENTRAGDPTKVDRPLSKYSPSARQILCRAHLPIQLFRYACRWWSAVFAETPVLHLVP